MSALRLRLAALPVAAVLLAGTVADQPGMTPAGNLPEAEGEDYRRGIGRLEDGVLRATLELRVAAWKPWGDAGATLQTHVFAADGEAPRVPAPLVRVRAGTPVHLTVRNSVGDLLILRGLRDRGEFPPGAPPVAPIGLDSVAVPPGRTVEVRFTPTEPGTFLYFGRTLAPGEDARTPTPLPIRPADRSLWGVLIVDPPEGAAPSSAGERILLITHWGDPVLPASYQPATRFFLNGRSWPHTERLEYTQGDTIRWRVLNATGRPHPMHLHGAYFHVDARGTQLRETVFPAAERRLVVTETLAATEAMRISWVAREPGNWLFHCHFMRHMSGTQTWPPREHAGHGAGPAADDLMAGLVLGVQVRPAPGSAPRAEPARRRLNLHVTRRKGVFAGAPAYAFVLAEGGRPPAPDSVRFPGSTLLLTRDEPTEIVVHNGSDLPLGVHWHGIELESWADGVPGWSGRAGAVVPAIRPGDSLAVRMAPPRAGTFMYHVHSEPGHELAQGLYGPLLVLEPGQAWDPEHDRWFLLGSLGTGDDPPPAINGVRSPGALHLRQGTNHRLRFMHISPDDHKRVTLLLNEQPVAWRWIAKDGADLPASQVRNTPADLTIHVGETYDFEWMPAAGDYTLRVITTFDTGVGAMPRSAPAPDTTLVRLLVRE